MSYIDEFIQALPDLYSSSNTDGWIACVVAENKNAELQRRLLQRLEEAPESDLSVMNYGSMKGSHALQRSLCELLERTFVRSHRVTLEPSNMVVMSGCTACINSLAFCLLDEGDGVLLPLPTYAAFDNDLKAQARLKPVHFSLDELRGDIESQLDAAVEDARGRGITVRALLVTNPSNPLGTIFSDDTIRAMVGWALERGIHYVADEIYALSVHEPGVMCKSAMCILYEELVETGAVSVDVARTHFHLLYGLSKDWCASGLRVGCLYSDNEPLQEALNSLAPMASVSNYVQDKVAVVLGDEAFTEAFVADNAAYLRRLYGVLTTGLRRLSVPFVEAQSGIFVWVDLSSWMEEQTFEGEEKLWRRLCNKVKVLWTPGKACHSPRPGCFRVCFAWVDEAAIEAMIGRLGQLLG